jgi:hypothetical protein
MLQLIDPEAKPSPRPQFQLKNSSLYGKSKANASESKQVKNTVSVFAQENGRP